MLCRGLSNNMARLAWIIFAVCVISCSAQFGFQRRHRQRAPNRSISPFGVNTDDKKCFTLARRPFYMSRLVQYPCHSRQPGVPVLRWFMGPMGPVCVSYVREPIYRYYRIPLCCPGYAMDNNGKCTIMTRRNAPTSRRTPDDMMAVAANMRRAMYLRATQDMAKRQAMYFANMRNNMASRRNSQQPTPQEIMMQRMSRRPMPPMSPMSRMVYNIPRPNITPPRVAFLRFNQPTLPMPHPVQQPPVTRGMIKIIKRKFIPFYPLMARSMNRPRPNMQPSQSGKEQPTVPRVVLSARAGMSPIARMAALRPQMAPFLQFAAPRQSFQQMDVNSEYQANDAPTPTEEQKQEKAYHDHSDPSHVHTNDGFMDQNSGEPQLPYVNLPGEPIQMPEPVVEQVPANTGGQPSCISTLEAAVKSCLKQSNIDVPDVMSAFEPFNDDKARVLCEAEDTIVNCISDALKECDQAAADADMARDMLLDTAQNVQSMCELRQATVAQAGQGDTMATVENVDAIPTDVKSAAPVANKDITIIEEASPSAEAVKEAIQHEVHVQEIRMKEYLLPILVGSGVGFMVLVLLLSLFICCCCKRRFRKKMRMAKEFEKPQSKDGIYTIGIPPPQYEVKGIPPMYYEEAKGEKISSRSSSVQEGSDKEEPEEANGTQM